MLGSKVQLCAELEILCLEGKGGKGREGRGGEGRGGEASGGEGREGKGREGGRKGWTVCSVSRSKMMDLLSCMGVE